MTYAHLVCAGMAQWRPWLTPGGCRLVDGTPTTGPAAAQPGPGRRTASYNAKEG